MDSVFAGMWYISPSSSNFNTHPFSSCWKSVEKVASLAYYDCGYLFGTALMTGIVILLLKWPGFVIIVLLVQCIGQSWQPFY